VTRLVREYSIDLIFERETSFGAGAIASRMTGRPFVLEVIGNRVNRLQVRNSHKIIAYSKGMFEGDEVSKVELVSGAVNTETFSPNAASGQEARAAYSMGSHPVVGYVGTFQEWHGLDELIGAAKHLLQRRNDVKFLMVGPYYRETERKVIDAGIANSFIFTGPIQYEQVPKFMNASDVLVAPYNPGRIQSSEQVRKHGLGAPLKVFEYMSVGKPTITTDVKPISDPIENGVTGYLVPPGDSGALGAAIEKALDDPEAARKVGEAGRRFIVANYSWGLVAAQLDRIFRLVLGSSQTKEN
jgi:glycosyltransferase involved in cell wall biosynthesis